MGLHEQALLAVLGNYIEKIGPILSLIGLGTIASAIGGYFSRSPPALFAFAFDEVKSYYQPIITGQYIRNIMN
jgi:hypothetical protein